VNIVEMEGRGKFSCGIQFFGDAVLTNLWQEHTNRLVWKLSEKVIGRGGGF
jgi:hypothetical protein